MIQCIFKKTHGGGRTSQRLDRENKRVRTSFSAIRVLGAPASAPGAPRTRRYRSARTTAVQLPAASLRVVRVHAIAQHVLQVHEQPGHLIKHDGGNGGETRGGGRRGRRGGRKKRSYLCLSSNACPVPGMQLLTMHPHLYILRNTSFRHGGITARCLLHSGHHQPLSTWGARGKVKGLVVSRAPVSSAASLMAMNTTSL